MSVYLEIQAEFSTLPGGWEPELSFSTPLRSTPSISTLWEIFHLGVSPGKAVHGAPSRELVIPKPDRPTTRETPETGQGAGKD